MKNILIDDFSSDLFELSEDNIYNILEEFGEKQNIDKTLTYVFIKAFYIHVAKIILEKKINSRDENFFSYVWRIFVPFF